jgi:hypothetical protein
MKKKLLFFLICIFFYSQISNSFSSISKYFGNSKINLDEAGIINFVRYLNGTFHAENVIFNRAAKIMSPMYYAVTEDGKTGYGWFCRSHSSSDCYDDFLAFKTVEHCGEYSGKKCFIFAYRNEIVWNNFNTKVNELDIFKITDLFKELKLYNQNSLQKINKENFLPYINLDQDKCSSNKNSVPVSKLRGSNLDCLLPGQYEQTINDKSSGSDIN